MFDFIRFKINKSVLLAVLMASVLAIAFVNCGEQGVGGVAEPYAESSSKGITLGAGPGNGRIFEGKVKYVHLGRSDCEAGISSEIISDHDRLFLVRKNCETVEPVVVNPSEIQNVRAEVVRYQGKVYFDKGLVGPEVFESMRGMVVDGDVSTPAVNFVLGLPNPIAVAKYECRLDQASWMSCANQVSYQNVGPGSHSFHVRSLDDAGALIAHEVFRWANGRWSSYGAWGACSKTCGGGTRVRRRACTNPAPQNGGYGCQGERVDRGSCNPIPCKTSCSGERGPKWGCDGNKKVFAKYSKAKCKKLCEDSSRTCCGFHQDGNCILGDQRVRKPGCSGCSAMVCR